MKIPIFAFLFYVFSLTVQAQLLEPHNKKDDEQITLPAQALLLESPSIVLGWDNAMQVESYAVTIILKTRVGKMGAIYIATYTATDAVALLNLLKSGAVNEITVYRVFVGNIMTGQPCELCPISVIGTKTGLEKAGAYIPIADLPLPSWLTQEDDFTQKTWHWFRSAGFYIQSLSKFHYLKTNVDLHYIRAPTILNPSASERDIRLALANAVEQTIQQYKLREKGIEYVIGDE